MISKAKQVALEGLIPACMLVFLCSQTFAQSVQKDLETGLTSSGKGLSCNQVYLSDGENIIKRNTFIYGETYYVNFESMDGFVRENRRAFPDMQLLIVDGQGDTSLLEKDMYSGYKDGIDFDPMDLYAEVTVADPIHSGTVYSLIVNISDKKGVGTFRTSLDFSVVRDERIRVEGAGLTCRELYLFSQNSGHTLTTGRMGFDETVYLLFEGLEGMTAHEGQVQLGLSMLVKDAVGRVILDEPDLFGDGSLSYADVHAQVAPSLILSGSQIENPVHCTIRIWDKRGDGWIQASTELVVE
jgi:hypothetical protein